MHVKKVWQCEHSHPLLGPADTSLHWSSRWTLQHGGVCKLSYPYTSPQHHETPAVWPPPCDLKGWGFERVLNLQDPTYGCAKGCKTNNRSVSPMYAAQWIALLSFLSNAFIFAPLDSSNRTIWKTCITLYTIIKINLQCEYSSLHCTSKYFMNSEP